MPSPPRGKGSLRSSEAVVHAVATARLRAHPADPTGSQAAHGVQVVTVLEEDAGQAAVNAAPVCFVQTSTRSLAEPATARARHAGPRGLIAVTGRRRAQLLSRSDSTLRGHAMAEAAALQAVRGQELGSGFDGVLLVPAFLEAGRLTASGIHWVRIGPDLVPAGQTEFAQDLVSGYTASDL